MSRVLVTNWLVIAYVVGTAIGIPSGQAPAFRHGVYDQNEIRNYLVKIVCNVIIFRLGLLLPFRTD